jgi:hypothetical protein
MPFFINFFKNWREALIGITIALLLIITSESIIRVYRDYIPSSTFFEVIQIYVPDHIPGSNPAILYDRIIKRDFYGTYTVEIQKINDDAVDTARLETVCVGKGTHTYTTTTKLPISNNLTWEWFISNTCVVGPGTYRLQATWNISAPRYGNKIYVATSNIFNVGYEFTN